MLKTIAVLSTILSSASVVAQSLPDYEILPYAREVPASGEFRYFAHKIDRKNNRFYLCRVYVQGSGSAYLATECRAQNAIIPNANVSSFAVLGGHLQTRYWEANFG